MWWGSNSKEQREVLLPKSLVAVEPVGNGASLARGAAAACSECPSPARSAGTLSARPGEEHAVPGWAVTWDRLQS